jgi:hypothetical protein
MLESWHLDRRVPIAIIGALIMQTMLLGWWTSKVDSRIENLERSDMRTDTLIQSRIKMADDRFEGLQRDRDRIVRVEEQLKALLDLVRRIDQRLERTGGALPH